MDDKKLLNKKNPWTLSDTDEWNLKPKGTSLFYIENVSRNKVLGCTNNGQVIEEDFIEDKAGQLWKKGEPNSKGYFVLTNSTSEKVMSFENSLQIKGKYLLQYLHTYVLNLSR